MVTPPVDEPDEPTDPAEPVVTEPTPEPEDPEEPATTECTPEPEEPSTAKPTTAPQQLAVTEPDEPEAEFTQPEAST